MQVEATLKDNKWHDLTHWGIRAALGVTFLVHSLKKFDPSWQGWLVDTAGLPAEMQLPIALAEFIGGIFLLTGVLTRITGAVFSVILLGAIFHIRFENGFFISQGGWEWDMLMLAVALTIIAAGPGKISISHFVKRIPRFLQ
jgi:putative oxidoreductase